MSDLSTLPTPDLLRVLQQEVASLKEDSRAQQAEILRLRAAIRALKDLQDSLAEITPESDAMALVHHILTLALEAIDSENGSLLLRDEETGELVFVAVYGPYRDVLQGFRLPVGEGIAGWVVANNQPELVPDVRHEPRFSPYVDQTIGFRTTSLICVPLAHEGHVMGALEVVNARSGAEFTEEDLDIMLLFARLAVEAMVRAGN